MPGPRPPPTEPTEASLRASALHYLARYAATEAGLRAVLQRRIDRWARSVGDADIADRVAALRAAVRTIVAGFVELGVVNDNEYAAVRATGLMRAGRSKRDARQRLAFKGIGAALADAVLPDDPAAELAAALILARKRRIGPFRVGAEPDAMGRQKEWGILARAGFPRGVAEEALRMDADAAEERIVAFRRG